MLLLHVVNRQTIFEKSVYRKNTEKYPHENKDSIIYLVAFSRTSRGRKLDHLASLLPKIHSIIPVSCKKLFPMHNATSILQHMLCLQFTSNSQLEKSTVNKLLSQISFRQQDF